VKGLHGTAVAAIIDIRTGDVTFLPHLLTPRIYHGLIRFGESVYVFGGCQTGNYVDRQEEDLKSAETFDFELNQVWAELPNMCEARRPLTACIWRGLIYLSGSLNPSLEAFHPVSKTYTLLPLSLPSDSNTVVFPSFGNLVALSTSYISTIALTAAGDYKLTSKRHEKVTCGSRCPAVVWGGRVYLIQGDRTVVLDAEKGVRPPVAAKEWK